MKRGIDTSEVEQKLPITTELYGRAIPSGIIYDPDYENDALPEFLDDEDWITYIPNQDGELSFVKSEPITSVYFGKEPENPETDINLQFFDVYYQHLSFPNIMGLMPSLLDDIRNLATVLSKVAYYQSDLSDLNAAIQQFIRTELEYLFMVSRSAYDNLQFIIANTWEKLHTIDGDEDYSAQLPTSSFKDVALSGNDPVPVEDLEDKYGLPKALAEFYSDEAVFFSKIREFRDSVTHQGDSPKTIFIASDGLAVDTTKEPYCNFNVWEDEHIVNNGIAPLWPFIAHVVDQTVSALKRFIVGLFDQRIKVLPPIAKGYDVYIRGGNVGNLNHLDSLMHDDRWGKEFIKSVEERVQHSPPSN